MRSDSPPQIDDQVGQYDGGLGSGHKGLENVLNKFPRRTYHKSSDFFRDIRFILANRPLLKEALRADLVSYAFRERLMLVVTEVNGCRYCSYFHASEALKAGITPHELQAYLDGAIPSEAPAEEIPALFYAQHWAEKDAQPDPEALHRMVAVYGQQKADAIQVILRMIRVGNLLGNTGDYWLYCLSFGR